MEKIVIISSFREADGPAAHTGYLKKTLESMGLEVEIAKVDVNLMRKTTHRAKPLVKKEIARIVNLSNQSNGVIFQIEPGLYGPAPWIAYRRINKIIRGININMLIVIHGWTRPSIALDSSLGNLKKLINPAGRGERRHLFSLLFLRFHPSYRRFLKNLVKNTTVCFSLSDVNELKLYGSINSTYVPISYLQKEDIKRIISGSAVFRQKICERLNIGKGKKLIIAPGFINTYKNSIAIFDSLQYLPENYHLIIAGGLHPYGLQKNLSLFELLEAKAGNKMFMPSYIEQTLKQKKMYSREYPQHIRNRIHFIGSLDDDALNDWIAASDFVVLPYLNTITGQSGSGPFTLAIEIGNQSFFGSANVFKSQDFVESFSPFTFDSTNSAELAYLIKNADRDKAHYDSFVSKFKNLYNAESQAKTYLKLLGLGNG